MDRFLSGFFIEYKIISYKERKFSLLINLSKNEKVFFDYILLQDLVKFCQKKGKLIRGYYFNGNRNLKIRDVIEEIF
jgi:hypothetical protein